MDRPGLTTYLDSQFNPVATAANGGTAPTPSTFYSPAIDQALRAMGISEANLAAYVVPDQQPDTSDFIALGEYFALRQLCRLLVVQADVSVDQPKVQKALSQLHEQCSLMLKDALADVTQRGYGPNQFDLGRVQLDIFEPSQTGGIVWAGWGWAGD